MATLAGSGTALASTRRPSGPLWVFATMKYRSFSPTLKPLLMLRL